MWLIVYKIAAHLYPLIQLNINQDEWVRSLQTHVRHILCTCMALEKLGSFEIEVCRNYTCASFSTGIGYCVYHEQNTTEHKARVLFATEALQHVVQTSPPVLPAPPLAISEMCHDNFL